MTDVLAALRRADHASLNTAEREHSTCGGICVRCRTPSPCELLRAVRLVNDRDPDNGKPFPAEPSP